MIFDFGPLLEYIHVTSQYSNAVLVAILPHVSDVAKAVDLPIPQPITQGAVRSFRCSIVKSDPGGAIVLTNACRFKFTRGHIQSFNTADSYFLQQNPENIPKFYGQVYMSKEDAVKMARELIAKLGYSPESVFAELEPKIEMPPKIGTNTVPRYRIQWLDPRSGFPAADIEINAEKKRIERFNLASANLEKAPPSIAVQPDPLPKGNPLLKQMESDFNPAYGYALLPVVLQSVTEYGKRLNLPLDYPLTTNHVERFSCNDNGGWPHSELELTNGYRFIFRNSQVNGFYAPDCFFATERKPAKTKDFVGKWNLNEQEAIELARNVIAKLNYPTNLVHTHLKPTEVLKPQIIGKQIIPRYQITWMYPDPTTMTTWAVVEIDAGKKAIKSVYFDDKSFWGHPPNIGVPISLK